MRPGDLALVFFGFTYRPEICPATLGRLSTWLDASVPAPT